MCSEPRTAAPAPIMHPTVHDAPYARELIPLEPVDSVAITTICDKPSTSSCSTRGPRTACLGARQTPGHRRADA